MAKQPKKKPAKKPKKNPKPNMGVAFPNTVVIPGVHGSN